MFVSVEGGWKVVNFDIAKCTAVKFTAVKHIVARCTAVAMKGTAA